MPRPFEIALSLSLAAASPALAQDMLGVSYSGSIYALDSATGDAQVVGAGLFGHNCMARDEHGDLWTISRNLLGNPIFYLTRIDQASLQPEIVAVNRDVTALANAGGGELYSLEFVPGNEQLFRVDTTSGARTFIGATGAALDGMAVHQGTLYAWSDVEGLGTLDTTTGAFTSLGGPTTDLDWLAVRSDGELIGGGANLVTLDTTTGSFTAYATSGALLRGAETTGLLLPFGEGCGGVELRASGDLRAGSVLATQSTGYPTTGALVGIAGVIVVGASRTMSDDVPLPLDLDPLLGTSGCSLYVSADATAIGYTTGAATPSLFFPVELPATFAHATFYLQHAAFDFNGTWFWSNALQLHIGS